MAIYARRRFPVRGTRSSLVAQDVVEAFHAGRCQYSAQQNVLELHVQPGIEGAKIGRSVRTELMAARALLDESHFARIDLRLSRLLLRGLRKRRFDSRRRHRHRAAAELESDNSIGVLKFQSGAARRNLGDRDGGAAVAHLNRNILLAIDRVGHRRGHDVAPGIQNLEYFARVGRIDP